VVFRAVAEEEFPYKTKKLFVTFWLQKVKNKKFKAATTKAKPLVCQNERFFIYKQITIKEWISAHKSLPTHPS